MALCSGGEIVDESLRLILEEQVGPGVSQDVVVSLLKNISRKTFVRKPKNSSRMMMRRKSK